MAYKPYRSQAGRRVLAGMILGALLVGLTACAADGVRFVLAHWP